MPKRIDLTGQRFGRWTVCGYSGAGKWECQCECGKCDSVAGASLRFNKSKSCGCLASEVASARALELSGRRFGRITVLSLHSSTDTKQGVTCRRWNCVCECGKTLVCWQTSIRRARSCGCLRTENLVKKNKQKASERAANWKALRQLKDDNGYLTVSICGRRRPVHRIVMEEIEKRPLQPFEHVHHINGIRTDNRPENLKIVPVGHGAGQDPEDLIKAETPEAKAACLKLAQTYAAAAGIQWAPQPSQ